MYTYHSFYLCIHHGFSFVHVASRYHGLLFVYVFVSETGFLFVYMVIRYHGFLFVHTMVFHLFTYTTVFYLYMYLLDTMVFHLYMRLLDISPANSAQLDIMLTGGLDIISCKSGWLSYLYIAIVNYVDNCSCYNT